MQIIFCKKWTVFLLGFLVGFVLPFLYLICKQRKLDSGDVDLEIPQFPSKPEKLSDGSSTQGWAKIRDYNEWLMSENARKV